MALTSLASLSLSNLMDHFDKMEDVLSESIAPSLKLCLFPLLCKRGLVHDRNISKVSVCVCVCVCTPLQHRICFSSSVRAQPDNRAGLG